jgi:hypothetical protein
VNIILRCSVPEVLFTDFYAFTEHSNSKSAMGVKSSRNFLLDGQTI